MRLDVFLQPDDTRKVQMIRGLVQQKYVGLGQQRRGQADAHEPPTTELICRSRKLWVFEA